MHLPYVNIILPVYNAEETLRRCIDSILNQTYKNIRLIAVNDGSTDSSLDILMQYASYDDRIQIIDKPNGGVSAARNDAIAVSDGEFLQFADSDDKLTPNATEAMVSAALSTDADMVIADFYRVDDKYMDIKGSIPVPGPLSKKEFAAYFMKEPADYYFGVLWNKLYRRSIIADHGIVCSTELNWCEDLLFNLDYIEHAQRFVSVKTPVYYYVRNRNSLSHREGSMINSIKIKRKLFEPYKELFEDCEMFAKHKRQVRKFFIAAAKDERVNPFRNRLSDIDGDEITAERVRHIKDGQK